MLAVGSISMAPTVIASDIFAGSKLGSVFKFIPLLPAAAEIKMPALIQFWNPAINAEDETPTDAFITVGLLWPETYLFWCQATTVFNADITHVNNP